MAINVVVPVEKLEGENRVSLSPDGASLLIKKGFSVTVHSNAGLKAGFTNAAYEKAGCTVGDGYASADIILGVNPPELSQIENFPKDKVWIGTMSPHNNIEHVNAMEKAGISSFALDYVPRISRAQKMDVLSSQANLAGYKAVLLGANRMKKIFPLMMTAAGTITPAKVLIFGAGVAGLQAIATAKRLGAVVEVTDVRPETKEQVESLGGRFITVDAEGSKTEGGYAKEVSKEFLDKQKALIAEKIKDSDLVITTALVFGKKAPVLISEEMVNSMKTGSVIVDMAVSQGGNCALSKNGEEVEINGVTIIGEPNLPSLLATNASDLYGKNVVALILHLVNEEAISFDTTEEIIGGSLITHKGEIVNPKLLELINPK